MVTSHHVDAILVVSDEAYGLYVGKCYQSVAKMSQTPSTKLTPKWSQLTICSSSSPAKVNAIMAPPPKSPGPSSPAQA